MAEVRVEAILLKVNRRTGAPTYAFILEAPECTHPVGVVEKSGDVVCERCGEWLAEEGGRDPV